LYLCEKGHVEGGMVFQLLEDLTEMSTIRDCKEVFGYIESKQETLGKVSAGFRVLGFTHSKEMKEAKLGLWSKTLFESRH
jgi:hypothetical protein